MSHLQDMIDQASAEAAERVEYVLQEYGLIPSTQQAQNDLSTAIQAAVKELVTKCYIHQPTENTSAKPSGIVRTAYLDQFTDDEIIALANEYSSGTAEFEIAEEDHPALRKAYQDFYDSLPIAMQDLYTPPQNTTPVGNYLWARVNLKRYDHEVVTQIQETQSYGQNRR